jgi:hypothetical protein
LRASSQYPQLLKKSPSRTGVEPVSAVSAP